MAVIPEKSGITLKVVPKIDWSALHGELTSALLDEAKHLLATVLHRECPVCK